MSKEKSAVEKELKPCPFKNCRHGNPMIEEVHNGDGITPFGFRVMCYACGLQMNAMYSSKKNDLCKNWFKYSPNDSCWHEARESLIERWNTREYYPDREKLDMIEEILHQYDYDIGHIAMDAFGQALGWQK